MVGILAHVLIRRRRPNLTDYLHILTVKNGSKVFGWLIVRRKICRDIKWGKWHGEGYWGRKRRVFH